MLQHTRLYTPFLLICTFMVKLRSWIAAYRTWIFKSFYRHCQVLSRVAINGASWQQCDRTAVSYPDEGWPLSISNWFFPPRCFFKCTLLIFEMTLLDRIVYCPHLHTTESLWYTQFFLLILTIKVWDRGFNHLYLRDKVCKAQEGGYITYLKAHKLKS